MTAEKAALLTGGTLMGNGGAQFLGGRADSRLCRPGYLFAALKGENTDGGYYIKDAWSAGASVVLASPDALQLLRKDGAETALPDAEKALILVDDPLEALQELARSIRSAAPELRVAGVTGSNGKTTTKAILATMLRQEMGSGLLVSEGNYNSDIGLPLTLLSLEPSHRAAVLEMGMNRRGEMALLSSIARPDVAVITNIGTAHVGMLGSREGVASEKRAILNGAGSGSTAVIGADEPWTEFLLESYPGQVRFFGKIGENGWDSAEDRGLEGWKLTIYGNEILFSLPGRHNLLNAMAAAEAARAMGASEESVAEGLAEVRSVEGRMQVARGALTVIRDHYNANPESLEAAFELFNTLHSEGRKVLVLGELLELGDEVEPAMRNAGKTVAAMRPDGVFLLGPGTRPLLESARKDGFKGYGEVFTEFEALEGALKGYLRSGDTVLLKGSRMSALERLDAVLKEVEAL